MKRGIILVLMSVLLVTSLILSSCNTATTPISSTTTTTVSTTVSTPPTTVSTTSTATIDTTATTATTTTAATGNWWDSLGTPQYGGTLTIRESQDVINWDPYNSTNGLSMCCIWMEQPTAPNWTLNPTVFNYSIGYLPPDYSVGFLATKWEFTDPTTYVLHLRSNIYFQNISPANGRQLVAADVVYDYDRLFGLGDGFTSPSPYWGTQYGDLLSVTAPDNYTVIFKWHTPSEPSILSLLDTNSIANSIACPDAVKQWGDLNDWHHAIGTGPYILTDFVDNSSLSAVKNPNYWGYDERYPQNKLPYINKVSVLVIPSATATLAAVRSGKIDVDDGLVITDSNNLKKTNPEILQIGYPQGTIYTLAPRNDLAPYKDIRVREALQMAIDIPTIAQTYYQGQASTLPGTLTAYSITGYTYQYSDWPQSLKDTYTYNPTLAKQTLAAAGYPSGFNTDLVLESDADQGLYQIVQSELAAIGINMSIQLMDPASWQGYVLNSHKQDALSARNQGDLEITYDPSIQVGRFATGGRVNFEMVSDPTYDAFGPLAAAAATSDQLKQILVNENMYVAQQHYAISLCQPEVFTIYQPWLKGFSGQSGSVTGSMLWFFEYGARFWINSNLKTSLGH